LLKRYKSIFISDIHFGTNDCKANLLYNFLKHNTSESLYLIGDIIDGWKIKTNRFRWQQKHTDTLNLILRYAKHKGQVIYITGNHDDFLHPLIEYNISLGNVQIVNQAEYQGIDGKRYLIIHGDMFDGITKLHKWICFLGDRAYDFILNLNSKYNYIRHSFGFGYWSLSKYLKYKVKQAVNFIYQFENNLVLHCIKKGYDGVICGHIHNAEIKSINGIIYMNDGDWVESCTALVENYDGTWKIITWDKEI